MLQHKLNNDEKIISQNSGFPYIQNKIYVYMSFIMIVVFRTFQYALVFSGQFS